VNSSSKSRSVPGVRLGYLLGSEEVAKAVADFNYSEFLSVPRCGTTFVAADMVLRALWWREVRHGESQADALHHVLDTVCRQDGPGLTTTDVDVFYSLRASYLRECEINLAIIKDAQRQFAKELGELWLAATPHHNGFNVVAEIATGQDGRSFAAGLFRATGLRLLPSECFTFDGVPVVTPHGALAFRLSSAEDPAHLRAAAQVLSRHIREVSH
jgi:aspartate/methionine/tyrosine aminotransferase